MQLIKKVTEIIRHTQKKNPKYQKRLMKIVAFKHRKSEKNDNSWKYQQRDFSSQINSTFFLVYWFYLRPEILMILTQSLLI